VSGGAVFILLVAVIGLSRQSHDFDETEQLDHESAINIPLIDRLFPYSYFIKAIDHSFYYHFRLKIFACLQRNAKGTQAHIH